MRVSWWQLPGPAGFVGELIEDLWDGKSVVICLPEHTPGGLDVAVSRELSLKGGNRHWLYIDAAERGYDNPAELVYALGIPEVKRTDIQSARTLAEGGYLPRTLVWLGGVTPLNWGRWKEFILNYEYYSRPNRRDRLLFCVQLSGEVALNQIALDINLPARRWDGYVNGLDILIYAADGFRHSELTLPQKKLAIAVTVSLALWDPALCTRLASSDLRGIVSPEDILRRFSAERGWGGKCYEEDDPSLWAAGIATTFEGVTRLHSAALAHDDPHDEITRRVWSAEVEVMLPYVEERRRELVLSGRLDKVLSLPHTCEDGTEVTEIIKMEIGDIYFQISQMRRGGVQTRRVDLKTWQMIEILWDIRNSLSHLRPLCHDRHLTAIFGDS